MAPDERCGDLLEEIAQLEVQLPARDGLVEAVGVVEPERPERRDQLDAEPAARSAFDALNGTNRFAVLWRVHTAATPGTRAKRIAALVQMLAEGRRIH